MVPAPFRSLRVLQTLNVAAVGLALAAVVSVVFSLWFGDSTAAVATGLPTWVLGTFWAWLLRWPRTFKNTSFRVGWAASMPLAAVNSGIACAFVMLSKEHNPFPIPMSFFLGATFGVVCWLPALLLTLLCFGLPIASAQQLAARGLAGEERGERFVGLACVTMSALGLAGASFVPSDHDHPFLPLSYGFAILGLLTGGGASLLAYARERRRRRFVARAEAGEVPGYRIDATEEGKVLVRVVSQGEGYRVADFEEEVFDLGAEGEATRPRVIVR